MSRVEQIKESIQALSLEERTELAALLMAEFPDDAWDQQMKAAARNGKFDRLNAESDSGGSRRTQHSTGLRLL